MPHPAADLLNRSREAYREERYADAKKDLLAAAELCRDLGGGKPLAVALRQLGEAERRLGNRAAALKAYEEAIALMRKIPEPRLLAHTVRHLGDVHQEQGNPQLARPFYEEALAIYRGDKQSHPMDVANAVRAFAAHRYDAGELEQSGPLWEEARETYGRFEIHAGVAGCSIRLAHIAKHQGNHALAQRRLAEARAAAEASDEEDALANVARAEKELG